MAATAEVRPKIEYAGSTRDIFDWGGSLVLGQEASLELLEGQETVNFDNYEKGVAEMLRTAKGFDKVLDLDVTDIEYKIRDDKVCAADGKPMVERATAGVEAAKKLAKDHPELEAFVVRDQGDVIVAQAFDQLLPGQTLTAVSVEPKKELKGKYRPLFIQKGFRDGLIYVQKFSRVDEHTIKAGFYSIDMSDIDVLRDLMLEEYGVEIPADVDPNKFIHHYAVSYETPEEAEKQAKAMRAEHYKRIGATQKRYSASELVRQNRSITRAFFDAYYPKLAIAARTGKNQPALKSFTSSVQNANIADLKPEIKQSLAKVSVSEEINQDDIDYINTMIQYATVEEIRKQLPDFINEKPVSHHIARVQDYYAGSWNQDANIRFTNELLARNISYGIKNGHAYGGCPAIQLAQQKLGDNLLPSINGAAEAYLGNYDDAQEAFGKTCKTIKHGISTNCPHCKQRVKTIVPQEGGEVFCSNSKCIKAAAGYLIKSVVGEKEPKQYTTSVPKVNINFLSEQKASKPKEQPVLTGLSIA